MQKINDLVIKFESIDHQIRSYFYPILYYLFDSKMLKGGKLPNKKASEAISINSFWIEENGRVSVSYDLWWGGDIFDSEGISLYTEEWEQLNSQDITKG